MDDATKLKIQEEARIAAEETQRVARENMKANVAFAAKTSLKYGMMAISIAMIGFVVLFFIFLKIMFR